MTAGGVDFLEAWVSENVTPLHVEGDVLVRTLAQKLRDDAGAAGLTFVDLGIEGQSVEQFIRETITSGAEPGRPGD